MTWRANGSARARALHAEDVIASAKSLSARAQALRERGRELTCRTKRNRSETAVLLVNAHHFIKLSEQLMDRWRKDQTFLE